MSANIPPQIWGAYKHKYKYKHIFSDAGANLNSELHTKHVLLISMSTEYILCRRRQQITQIQENIVFMYQPVADKEDSFSFFLALAWSIGLSIVVSIVLSTYLYRSIYQSILPSIDL